MPVSLGITPHGLMAVGDRLFFTARDESNGSELWQSDGTAAGTALVADLTPGPASTGMELLADVDGTLTFRLHQAGGGFALWRSDGTAAGTMAVATLPTATACTGAAAADGALWLVIDDVLWRSDGTTAGTEHIASVPGLRSLGQFTALRHVVFFVTYRPTWGGGRASDALWRTDGTSAGTRRVSPLRDDGLGDSPSSLTPIDDGLLYLAYSDSGRGLYRSDVDGNVAFLGPVPSASPFRTLGGQLPFFANLPGGGWGLWESDDSGAGSRQLAAGFGEPYSGLVLAGETAFFTLEDDATGHELWAVPLDALGRCGNGAIDVGEACDDGNQRDDDCCSSTCGSAAAGRSCADGDLCNGAEVCCTGDCDGDFTVDIAELLAMVRALLHGAALPCAVGAPTGEGGLTVDPGGGRARPRPRRLPRPSAVARPASRRRRRRGRRRARLAGHAHGGAGGCAHSTTGAGMPPRRGGGGRQAARKMLRHRK